MANRVIQPKAIRSGQKARVALAGPPGTGKTWSALEIAKTLSDDKPILVIDTEFGSASLYGDAFDFATVRWEPPFSPRELAQFITEQAPKYGVIIIDSLSHFWIGEGGTVRIADEAGRREKGGNSFAGWSVATPIQQGMLEALLAAPCHILATLRTKIGYDTENKNGRMSVTKVGLAPVQREGLEYEFTVVADIDQEHRLMVTKSRCLPLSDKSFPAGKAGEMGKTLRDWLSSAAVQEAPEPTAQPEATPTTTEPEPDTSALIPPPPESVKKTGVVAGKDEAAAISKEYAAATQMDVSTVQRWARQKLEAAGVKFPPAAEWTAKDYGVYTNYVKQALVEFLARKAAREEAEKSTEPRELETVQL